MSTAEKNSQLSLDRPVPVSAPRVHAQMSLGMDLQDTAIKPAPRRKRDTGNIRLNSSFSRKPLIPAHSTNKPVTFYGMTGWRPKPGEGAFPLTPCKVRLRVGAVAKNRTRDDQGDLCPSLHIELWHLILVLLSFFPTREDIASNAIAPTFGEVWRRFSCTNAKPSADQLANFTKLLKELAGLHMAILIGDEKEEYIVDVFSYGTHRKEFNFGVVENVFYGLTFHQCFIDCMIYADHGQDVRLDVLAGITSRTVRAAYLWLPARAANHFHEQPATDPSAQNPEYNGQMAVLSSEEFMNALGFPPMPKWKRKTKLTNHGAKSILGQLHGKFLLGQHKSLGVAWWDGPNDFYIGTYCFRDPEWVEGDSVGTWQGKASAAPDRTPKERDLLKNFTAGGGTKKAFWHHLAAWQRIDLDSYFIERMTALGVKNISKYEIFYKQAIALLGPDYFTDAIGALATAKPRKTDTGFVFRGILFERVKQHAFKRTQQAPGGGI